MRIIDLRTVPVRAGFFVDDQAAITAGAARDGFGYRGEPVTPGFSAIRQAGEALSVLLFLDDGSIAHGDCAVSQYSGAGGRDPVFGSVSAARDIEEYLAPLLIGAELTSFREMAGAIDRTRTPTGTLHTAIRYGVTQALLDAVAHRNRLTMAEVICAEYGTGVELAPIPMFAQTGDDRYLNAEKMILKLVDVLPHGLINDVKTKLGPSGELLEEYLTWLVRRIGELRPSPDYQPQLHFDTYGTIGAAFGGSVPAVARYLAGLGRLAAPYQLTIEHPIDAGGRDAQVETYVRLKAELVRLGSQVRIAVDEWCNTLADIELFVQRRAADVIHVKTPDLGGVDQSIEALLLVRRHGLVAYCGGTCTETERSAQITAHVAMACGAGQILAKPGMGVDEGLMIVGNEMARVMAVVDRRRAMAEGTEMTIRSNPELARLSAEFFQVQHTGDPFNATQLGVIGFDGLVPDPSREGSAAFIARIADIEKRLEAIDLGTLDAADRINAAVLSRLAWGARSDLEHCLWETSASADAYSSPQAMMFMSVPTASVGDERAAEQYVTRLAGLPVFLDAIATRYRVAAAEGRLPTRVGVGQAIDQLTGHLALDAEQDTLLGPLRAGGAAFEAFRQRASDILQGAVRPALRRLLDCLENEMLPVARADDRVGIRFVPGGEQGYRAAIRRHTTTDLTPEDIHQIGLDCIADLRREWEVLGARVLGTDVLPEIFARLRNDPSLRFEHRAQIVTTVADALGRAEAVRDRWFPPFDIADCVIEEINPIEAGNAAMAYYRPPSGDGSRPGAHCVLTDRPEDRFVYEYEALAFHESTPGHHLQIASAQTLTELPDFRRFLDAEVCGYVEGWGLYSERLADEMGLYTSDLARLGMLSFDALRACRLVVDTGMHHLGWSRAQAVQYMWENTATTAANVRNEIDRYISWPGQALAYMIGRREITRLRAVAQERLGSEFDVRSFHGAVLGNGAVPLDVLEQIILDWIDSSLSHSHSHSKE